MYVLVRIVSKCTYVFTKSRLLQRWENFVHGQYLYVDDGIYKYLDSIRQHDSEFNSIAQ